MCGIEQQGVSNKMHNSVYAVKLWTEWDVVLHIYIVNSIEKKQI